MLTTKLTDELHDILGDLVEEWHDLPAGDPRHDEPLSDYLRMTREQYAAFVENRDLPGRYVPPPLQSRTSEEGVDISKVIGSTPSQYARRLDPDPRQGNGGALIVLALMLVGTFAFLVRLYTEVK